MIKLIILIFLSTMAYSHPVSYTIDLTVFYDETSKKFTVKCKSNSRNKCGLHNFHLLDKDDKILKTARFPFLKSQTKTTVKIKPAKMIFFLRKIPEHTYNVIVE